MAHFLAGFLERVVADLRGKDIAGYERVDGTDPNFMNGTGNAPLPRRASCVVLHCVALCCMHACVRTHNMRQWNNAHTHMHVHTCVYTCMCMYTHTHSSCNTQLIGCCRDSPVLPASNEHFADFLFFPLLCLFRIRRVPPSQRLCVPALGIHFVWRVHTAAPGFARSAAPQHARFSQRAILRHKQSRQST